MADTLTIARDLEAAGFNRDQAEAVARAVDAASAARPAGIRAEMVTKADFKVEFAEVKARVAAIETRVTAIEGRVEAIETEVKEIKTRLTSVETGIARLETRMLRFGIGLALTLVGTQIALAIGL